MPYIKNGKEEAERLSKSILITNVKKFANLG